MPCSQGTDGRWTYGRFMSRTNVLRQLLMYAAVLLLLYGCGKRAPDGGVIGNPATTPAKALQGLESATGKTFPGGAVIAEWSDSRSAPPAAPEVWVVLFPPTVKVDLGTLIGCEPIEMPLGTCVAVIEGNLDSRRIEAPAQASSCVWETTKDSFSATVVQGSEGTYLSIQRTAK